MTDEIEIERFRVVVLHGGRASPEMNWFPWLHKELEARGIDVIRPRLPTPEGHSLRSWLEAYDCSVSDRQGSGTVLVGHSLGTALALRLAERARAPYTALFLVAGFVGLLGLPDFDPLIKSFFDSPLDWRRIREGMVHCKCWAGDDDPYVPLDRSRVLADHLQVPLEVIRGGGHINSESGFLHFPAILNAILNIVPRKNMKFHYEG